MQIETIEAGQVFKQLKGNSASLELPYGKYDENDPEDKQLMTLIPKVDPYYRFPGIHVIPLLLVAQERDNALLVGSTGVGKTMLAMQLAAKLKLPATRLNLHGELGSAEVFGYYGLTDPSNPKDDGWKWTAFVKGICRPGIVIIDEWDAGRAELTIGFQRLLEDHDPGVLLMERDEFVRRDKDCILFATANTRGMGDETGLYAGTGSQNFAQLNRFHVVMEMQPLSPKNLRAVLKQVEFHGYKLQDDLVDALIGFYQSTLSAFEQRSLSTPLSVRMMIHFAKYFLVLANSALEMSVLSKLPTETDRQTVKELAIRHNLAEATPTA
jgi:cobaltochelatase CobS